MIQREVVGAEAGGNEGSSRSKGGGELAETLERRRLYREVTLALRAGLQDAKAEFSFLRARGLCSLLGFLRSTASAPDESQVSILHAAIDAPLLSPSLSAVTAPPRFDVIGIVTGAYPAVMFDVKDLISIIWCLLGQISALDKK